MKDIEALSAFPERSNGKPHNTYNSKKVKGSM